MSVLSVIFLVSFSFNSIIYLFIPLILSCFILIVFIISLFHCFSFYFSFTILYLFLSYIPLFFHFLSVFFSFCICPYSSILFLSLLLFSLTYIFYLTLPHFVIFFRFFFFRLTFFAIFFIFVSSSLVSSLYMFSYVSPQSSHTVQNWLQTSIFNSLLFCHLHFINLNYSLFPSITIIPFWTVEVNELYA